MNTTELNKVLSSEIYRLRAGRAKPERVNAVSRAASQIIAAARMELEYARLVGMPNRVMSFFANHGARKALPAPKKPNGK